MLYFFMDEKMAEARIDEMINVVKEYRQVQKTSRERIFHLPKLSNLFANWKSVKKTAVAIQA